MGFILEGVVREKEFQGRRIDQPKIIFCLPCDKRIWSNKYLEGAIYVRSRLNKFQS